MPKTYHTMQTVEIEAESDEEAFERVKDHDFGEAPLVGGTTIQKVKGDAA